MFVYHLGNLFSYEYCSEKKGICPPSMKHVGCSNDMIVSNIFCLFKEAFISKLFQRAHGDIGIPHTKKFIEIAKFEHDKIRNSVACGVYHASNDNKQKYPKAAKMKAFQWNYELGFLSKQIASTCDDSFDLVYCFQSPRFPTLGVMSHFSYASKTHKKHFFRNPIPDIAGIIRKWPKAEIGPKDNILTNPNA